MNKLFPLFLFLVFIILTGCSQPPETPKTLTLRLKQDITTLDPAFIVDVDGGKVAAKIFNGLVKYDADLNIVPDIAQSWSISQDGKTYRFTLKPKVLFSDGTPLSAEDVLASFKRVKNPKTLSPRKWIFDSAYSFSLIDNLTFEIKLKRPFSPFLSLLTLPNAYIVPKNISKDFKYHPVGTGPYYLKKWKTSTEIILSKNAHYFEQSPFLNQIVYKIIPEDFVTVGEFERKIIDAMEIPRADFSHYIHNEKLKPQIIEQTGLNTYYLGFNCRKAPFSSKLFRQAVSYAVNKKEIAQKVLEGRCQIATGPVPPPLNPDQKPIPETYAYTPEKAIQLIQKSGLTRPIKINFYINQDKEVFNIASLIREDLQKVGIEANLVLRDWSAFKEAINKGEADCFFLSWWADYPDIENFLYPTFHSDNFGGGGNRAFYKNQMVDQLLERAAKTIEPAKRNSLYQKAQKQIIEEAPWIFLWHRKTYTIRQPYVKNFQVFPVYTMEKGTQIALDH